MADNVGSDLVKSAAAELFRGESEMAGLMRRHDWDATALGPVAGQVEVRLEEIEGEAASNVSDTGPSLSEPELPHLFGRFHRVEGVTGRSIEGSGIG